jgi:hypothetical protein
MLNLLDALKWVQIGACLAVGFYIVRWTGVLILVIFGN